MRVLHVIPSISGRRGGPTHALLAMASGLAGEGVIVEVATTDDDGFGRAVSDAPSVWDARAIVHVFARQTRPYAFSWPLTVWLARNIPRFDIVHIHALFSYASAPAALLARRNRVPYVVRPLGTLSAWGMSSRRPRLKRLSFRVIERRILVGAAGVHYTSQTEQEEAERLGVRSTAFVIPIGIAAGPGARAPTTRTVSPFSGAWASQTPTVLFLSRVDRKKGLDLLVSAFSILARERGGGRLDIAGEGDEGLTAEIKELARRLGVSDRVRWLGAVHGARKAEVFAAADVFVLPSYSENFGIAAAEAMAAGVPVVVSDRVGIARDIADARAGVVTSCEPSAIAGAIAQVLDDPAEASTMAERARQLVAERYSVDAMSLSLMSMYEEILARSPAPARLHGAESRSA